MSVPFPHGQFWSEIAYATRVMHGFAGRQYPNPDRWWEALWNEWHAPRPAPPTRPRSKTEAFKDAKSAIRALRNITGDPDDISFPDSPVFEDFLKSGYVRASQSSSFEKKFWNPFLKSFGNLIKTLEGKDFGALATQGDQVVLKIGPKKSKPQPMI